MDLRRPLDEGEHLVRCKTCGRIEVPLNDAETWHYVRTGVGLASDCKPKPGRILAPCKWEEYDPAPHDLHP